MAKKEESAGEPQAFPITLEEFLHTIQKPETRGGFAHLMKQEKVGGHKPASEWEKLLEQFKTKPCGMSWQDHVTPKTEGGE